MFGKLSAVALLTVTGFAASPPCPLAHKVAPADDLESVASFYFGSQTYASSILLATNSRTSEGFKFIPSPFSLSGIPAVCIPVTPEAERSRARYAIYEKAVRSMAVARPSEVLPASALVTITEGQPVTVASWTRAGKFKVGPATLTGDLWVTVSPHLHDFCKKFFAEHNRNEDELTLRIEQRVGLPPYAGYTTMAIMTIDQPGPSTIFRPCSDPATSVAHCEAGGPGPETTPQYKAWFTGQYYFAYGTPSPSLYPWTSLGYTFDWAQKSDGDFVRFGESEFVIPAGTRVNILALPTTAQYCSS